MSLVRPLALASFGLAILGCNPSTDGTSSQRAFVNRCSSDTDCGVGESCAANTCYTMAPTVSDVVFEVIPGPLSSYAPEQVFQVQANLLSLPQQRYDVVLPPTAQIAYGVTLGGRSLTDPDSPDGKSTCAWTATPLTKSVAMHASFFPRGRALGLPQSPVSVAPVAVSDGLGVVSYRLSTTLPPGEYDVYLQPTNDAGCEIPPWLLRDQLIVGNQPLGLPAIVVTANTSFQGTIRTRAGVSLEGWRVDIIDPSTGLRLSTRGTVGAPTATVEGSNEYNVSPFGAWVNDSLYPLQYLNPLDSNNTTLNDPTLRLRPPTDLDTPAPSFTWSIPRNARHRQHQQNRHRSSRLLAHAHSSKRTDRAKRHRHAGHRSHLAS
ncbi:MAG: hypothetical protein U0165_20175 [Polyangiaceae bacterium]